MYTELVQHHQPQLRCSQSSRDAKATKYSEYLTALVTLTLMTNDRVVRRRVDLLHTSVQLSACAVNPPYPHKYQLSLVDPRDRVVL